MVSSLRAIVIGWLRLSRWHDWCTSKLTYTGAAIALLAPQESSVVVLLAVVGTIAAWAAFGYGINEVADRQCDQQAGKSNRAAGLSRATWSLFLLLTAGSSLGLTLLWRADAAAPALVLAGLVLSAGYSLPPLRLKERGAMGLVAAAVAQWGLPVLAVSAIQPWGSLRPGPWCLALLGLAIGMRWIAVHQMHDTAVDRNAGVQTYASGGGRIWLVIMGAFLSELVLLATTLVITLPESIPAIVALGLSIILQLLPRPRGDSFRKRLQGYEHAPLREYYFLLLPVTLAVGRGLSSPAFLLLAAMFLVLGSGYVGGTIADLRRSWQPGEVIE
jgi:4-hydroxybenzoate polyprenyltransferase